MIAGARPRPHESARSTLREGPRRSRSAESRADHQRQLHEERWATALIGGGCSDWRLRDQGRRGATSEWPSVATFAGLTRVRCSRRAASRWSLVHIILTAVEVALPSSRRRSWPTASSNRPSAAKSRTSGAGSATPPAKLSANSPYHSATRSVVATISRRAPARSPSSARSRCHKSSTASPASRSAAGPVTRLVTSARGTGFAPRSAR